MPVHNRTRVDTGLFHAFHQSWICALCDALNHGRMPPEYFAIPEQNTPGPIPEREVEWASKSCCGSGSAPSDFR